MRARKGKMMNASSIQIHKKSLILKFVLIGSWGYGYSILNYKLLQMTLPTNLRTSIETKNASIVYMIRCALTYKTFGNIFCVNPCRYILENETNKLHFVRGITVVEKFDIGLLPQEVYFRFIHFLLMNIVYFVQYFQPNPHNLLKKFGLFSCTGGQIKMNFQISCTAFVCGENIKIDGKMDNKTGFFA